jgi:deoxyribonuclease-4
MIPEELIIGVVKAANAPVVVETPSDDDGQKKDIAWLRERL